MYFSRMQKVVKLLLVGLMCCLLTPKSSWAQDGKEEKIKARKLSYKNFKDDYSFNDTTDVIIDLFFDKKNNSAVGQMSFLPIAIAIAIVPPPIRVIGVGLTIIAFPLFLNGAYTMYKFRNKKLLMVLTEYKKTGYLPKWVKKKAVNQLEYIDSLQLEY